VSRSRNSRWGSGSHPKRSCYLCTKRPPEERRRRNAMAPAVAEQLEAMCTCPACRGGYEGLCFAEVEIPELATDPMAWCAACGSYGCDGVGAAAFCETA
jgi:hypothetical protein